MSILSGLYVAISMARRGIDASDSAWQFVLFMALAFMFGALLWPARLVVEAIAFYDWMTDRGRPE